jgi:hypothetical protein
MNGIPSHHSESIPTQVFLSFNSLQSSRLSSENPMKGNIKVTEKVFVQTPRNSDEGGETYYNF